MNREWHQAHVLGRGASLEDRIAWHEEHARECRCRPMPDSIAAQIRARDAVAGPGGAERPGPDGAGRE